MLIFVLLFLYQRIICFLYNLFYSYYDGWFQYFGVTNCYKFQDNIIFKIVYSFVILVFMILIFFCCIKRTFFTKCIIILCSIAGSFFIYKLSSDMFTISHNRGYMDAINQKEFNIVTFDNIEYAVVYEQHSNMYLVESSTKKSTDGNTYIYLYQDTLHMLNMNGHTIIQTPKTFTRSLLADRVTTSLIITASSEPYEAGIIVIDGQNYVVRETIYNAKKENGILHISECYFEEIDKQDADGESNITRYLVIDDNYITCIDEIGTTINYVDLNKGNIRTYIVSKDEFDAMKQNGYY